MELSSDEELPTFSLLCRNQPETSRPQRQGLAPSPKRSKQTLRPVDDKNEQKVMKKKIDAKREAAMARKAERERLKAEKKHQQEMDKAIKKAAKESSKENSPAERLKQMIIILDTVLSENTDFMAALTPELREMELGYRVGRGDRVYPGGIRWKRMVTERSVDRVAKILQCTQENDERELLVTLEAQGFVGLVHYTKQLQVGGPLPSGAQSLQQYVEGVMERNPGMNVTLAVEGMDAFLRGKKTKFNRQFRQAVTGISSSSSSSSSLFSDVTRVDCEEAMVGLQLALGCGVRMCASADELAEYVITMTKAIAELPFKKENPFSFHIESGACTSKKALEEADNKVALIWKHQLMQLNNISDNMASAIVAAYPSPAHLLREYESSSDRKAAESLLQDIPVRRGVGVTASIRRLGPVQSKRIHTLMTSRDPTVTMD